MHAQFERLSLKALRQKWTDVWGTTPHKSIGRSMLVKSIVYKVRCQMGEGLTYKQQEQLSVLIRRYKRNPKCFDRGIPLIKPGTRLVRRWKGKDYQVKVLEKGFEYDGVTFTSLSKVAKHITGTQWNGLLFFGLKNKRKKGVPK